MLNLINRMRIHSIFVYLIIALLPVIIGMFKGFRMQWYESIFRWFSWYLIF